MIKNQRHDQQQPGQPKVRSIDREHFDSLQRDVQDFMTKGGQTTSKFNARQACLYMGLQLEEMAEKVAVLMDGTLTASQREHLQVLHITLDKFAREFKAGMHEGDFLRADHAELIDADFDTAWVSIGALLSTALFPMDAIAHGTYTNLDKFRDGCIKDANGKIKKPEGWQEPDFRPYVDPTPRG